METIKNKVIEFLLKEYVLGYVVQFYSMMKGYKTQICVALWVVVFIIKYAGFLEAGLADQVLRGLQVAGGFSFAQKLQRYLPIMESVQNSENLTPPK